MKTSHKKNTTSNYKIGKFSHTPITIKSIKNIFKFSQGQQIQNVKSYSTVGYSQIEKTVALEIEAEAHRNQGRIYANTTPMR